MADDITDVTKEILPDQKLDCVAYGCTSGTIAAGYSSIHKKVNLAKPNTKVTTPITSAIKDFKKTKILIKYQYLLLIQMKLINLLQNILKKKNVEVVSLSFFDIASDLDIGKVDPDYLFEVLSKIDLSESDALFVSCTALPVLSLIDKLEKKLGNSIKCIFLFCIIEDHNRAFSTKF